MKALSIPCESRRNQDSQSEIQSGRGQPASVITRRLRWRAIVLLAFALAGSSPLAAFAAETATIVNESNMDVVYYIKWSNVPFESQRLVLAPGESFSVSGPDGTRLDLRFNSAAPQLPIRELRYRVVTARTFDPRQPGFISSFRNVTPFLVDLFGF